MAKVESKTKTEICLEVIGRDGSKRGTIVLTGGNFNYYRINAKRITKQYTYIQLIDLIESNIEE